MFFTFIYFWWCLPHSSSRYFPSNLGSKWINVVWIQDTNTFSGHSGLEMRIRQKKMSRVLFFFLLLTQKMWKNHCVKVVCYQEYLFFSSPHLKTTVTYFHCCWISIFHLGLLLWKKIKAFCVLSFLVDHQHFWIQLSTFYWTKLGPIQLSTMSRYQIKVPRKLWAPPAIIMPSSYILRSSFIPQSTLVNIGFSKTMTAEKGPNHCRDAHKMI